MPEGGLSADKLDIVAIGASAGGVSAISALLHALPADLPATVFIATHRDPEIVSHLAHVLSRTTGLHVRIAQGGEPLSPGTCYMSEPGMHLTLDPNQRVRLVPAGHYPASDINVLFHSLARHAGPRTVGVILSGMLSDGAAGLHAIKDAGGITLVQDPAEAEFDQMPLNAIRFDGKVDYVGGTRALAGEICRLLGCRASAGDARSTAG